MQKVKISGISSKIDGEYPIDLGYFTNGELHLIKKLSGVRAGEIEEALDAGDNDIVVCVALIALKRNGRTDIPDGTLWDAKAGKIDLILPVAEKEAAPLAPKNEPSESSSSDESPPSSGLSLSNGGESPENGRSLTGGPGWGTPRVPSDPPTSLSSPRSS